MKKYLITSGCSFTAHSVEPTIAWPYHMSDWQVINCAEMASGNALISRNLISTIPHYVDKKPTVAVMWSNPNRFELSFLEAKTSCHFRADLVRNFCKSQLQF